MASPPVGLAGSADHGAGTSIGSRSNSLTHVFLCFGLNGG
jgi:hypothetical protein